MISNIISNKKILWYSIDKNGYIKGSLKNEPSIYIYMMISKEKSCYVGSSVKLVNRTNSHRYRINNWNKDYYNNNGALMFYNTVLKQGWENFKFGILEYTDLSNIENPIYKKDILLKREQYYLDIINPSLNTCKIAGSPLGIKHGITFSKNLSEARRGKKNKISKLEIITPKQITSETILKLSSRSIGIKVKLFDNLNNLINEFPTMASTAKYLGVSDRTIRRVLNTGISYDNYIYEFEIITAHPVILVNKENNQTKEFYSIRALAKDIGVSSSSVSKYINTNRLLKNVFLITKK